MQRCFIRMCATVPGISFRLPVGKKVQSPERKQEITPESGLAEKQTNNGESENK